MKIYKTVRYVGGLAAFSLTTLMPASAQDQAPAPLPPQVQLPERASLQNPAARLSARDMILQTRANIAEQASGAWLKAADQAMAQMSDPAGATNPAEMADLGTAYDMAVGNAQTTAEMSGAGREQALKRIQTATTRHQGTLSSVLDRVPEVAKTHIQHAMEMSQRGHDRAMQAIQNAGQGQNGQGRGGQDQNGQGRDRQDGQNRGGDEQDRPNQGRPEGNERENNGQGRGGQAGGQNRGGQNRSGQGQGGQGRGGQAGGQGRGGQGGQSGGQGRGGRR